MTVAPEIKKREEVSANRQDFLKSFVLLGLMAFLLVDNGLRLIYMSGTREHNVLNFSPLKVSHRSWVYWNYKDLVDAPGSAQKPQIAIFGSSLMMAALHGGDAVYTGLPQNVVIHHRSKLFKDLVKKQTGATVDNFAFALGGEMVSDAYVLLAQMLEQKEHPRCLIYGIAPRDFTDNTLPSVASTEIYKYAERLTDLSSLDMEARPSLAAKAEYYLGKICFIYGHREDLLYIQHHWAQSLAKKLLGYKNVELNITPLHIRRQAFLELPEDCAVNEGFVTPPQVEQEPYLDNTAEYRGRYRKINAKQFALQMQYLERILTLAQKNKIEVILVNMPLTAENINLMPANFYSDYLKQVQTLAKRDGCTLVDLNSASLFPKNKFADSVHLNNRGGKHFFEVLIKELAQDVNTRKMLTGANQ
ncbi:MAG: DUF1574 family protein [Candidatus Obscuribacter sp.]|nr:DUF1574 family protein [Candidatus Obscuribacter sp.]